MRKKREAVGALLGIPNVSYVHFKKFLLYIKSLIFKIVSIFVTELSAYILVMTC